MKNFPLEIYLIIFDYLNLKELSKCKLVCKRFHQAIKFLSINELIVRYKMQKCYWSFFADKSNGLRPFDYNRYVGPNFFGFVKHSQFNLRNLKRLNVVTDKVCFKMINKFDNLEYLQLSFCEYIGECKELKLSKLRSLLISSSARNTLHIDAPNLIEVEINDQYERINTQPVFELGNEDPHERVNLIFKYPLTIKYFKTHSIWSVEKVIQFKNLEYYECFKIYPKTLILLNNFSKLKEFRFFETDFVPENSLTSPLNWNKNVNRPDPIIYYAGRRLEYLNNQDQSKTNDYIQNLQLIPDNFCWIDEVDYNKLIIKFTDGLPDCFFRKIINIKTIYVTSKVDSDRLAEFIIRCVNLESLNIENASLDCSFYDRTLPSISSLFYLKIMESVKPDYKLDFKFVLKMFNLRTLETNLNLNLDSTFNLDRLIYLKGLRIKINDNQVKIDRLSNFYYVLKYNDVYIPNLNFSYMIKCIKYFNKALNFKKNLSLKPLKSLLRSVNSNYSEI